MTENVAMLAAVTVPLLTGCSLLALYLSHWRMNRSIRYATVAVRSHTRRDPSWTDSTHVRGVFVTPTR